MLMFIISGYHHSGYQPDGRYILMDQPFLNFYLIFLPLIQFLISESYYHLSILEYLLKSKQWKIELKGTETINLRGEESPPCFRAALTKNYKVKKEHGSINWTFWNLKCIYIYIFN